MCNLLLEETPTFASTDGSVREDLGSASAGWLFWSVADDANYNTVTAERLDRIIIFFFSRANFCFWYHKTKLTMAVSTGSI